MPNKDDNQKNTDLNSSGLVSFDWFYLVSIAAVVILFFHGTIFEGKPVSKIGLVKHYDALFNPEMKNAQYSSVFDPSLYQLHSPTNILTERLVKSGQLPLWNPLNGCGHSLIGDPQSFIFSPFRLLFPTSNMPLYNLGIILEVFLGALFVYLLCQKSTLDRAPSLFASLAFTLSPFYLWYFELPNHFALYPLAFYVFLRLAQTPSKYRAFFTGGVSACLIYTMHPECSFYALSLSTLFYISYRTQSRNPKDSIKEKLRALILSLKPIAIAALTAFCLSAPLLFPFIEFLYHSSSYKTEIASMGSKPLSWYALMLNLFYPANGIESPYLGAVALSLIPLSLIYSTRHMASWIIVSIVSFLIITHAGPSALFLETGLAKVLVPSYCIPAFLLSMTVLSANGLGVLISSEIGGKGKLLTAMVSALIVGATPLLLSYMTDPIFKNQYVPPLSTHLTNSPELRMESILAIVGLVVVCLFFSTKNKLDNYFWIPLIIVVLNSGCQLRYALNAMPAREKFEYQTPAIVEELQKLSGRSMATGIHTYLPDNNMIFETSDMRLYNPFFPKRYLDYIKQAGAQKHDLYLWGFSTHNISKLLDLASVRYIISSEPLQEANQEPLELLPNTDPITFKENDLRLSSIKALYSPDKKAIFLKIKATSASELIEPTTVQFGLFDSQCRLIWTSRNRLLAASNNPGELVLQFSAPVFQNLETDTELKAAVKIEGANQKALTPTNTQMRTISDYLVVSSYKVQNIEKKAQELDPSIRFKLISEDKVGVRLYENRQAMPETYFVSRALFVNTGSEALNIINKRNFDPYSTVVLEGKAKRSNPSKGSSVLHKERSFPKVSRPDNNHVEITLTNSDPGYLILTDTFYPGWVAYLDGKKVSIYRANYLFRGIEIVKSGNHTIRFVYSPQSLNYGIALFFAYLLLSSAITLFARSRRQTKEKSRS